MKFSTLLFFSVLVLPNAAYAFSYDFWNSGISLKEANNLAKKHNVKLIVERNSQDLANHVRSNSVYYKTTLFNKPARVKFTFTHSSNLLYQINISWEKLTKTSSKKLFLDVTKIVKKKYGDFSKTTGKSLMIKNGERCDGTLDGYSKILKGDQISLSLSTCFNLVNLRYSNDSLRQIHRKEAMKTGKTKSIDANKL